jgi:Rieske Fe-S protein
VDNYRRRQLVRSVKFAVLLSTVFVLYVCIDYSFNQVKLVREYRFEVPDLSDNRPVILNQGSMIIVVAHYNSGISDQFASSSENASRIDSEGYFVALAYGTDLGCPVQLAENQFKESCSNAKYDLLGQSLNQSAYSNLKIPNYHWNKNFTALTIYQE